MGKNNTIIKQWLSDEGRMASLINGCLFSGKQIFKKEHLKREDGVQGVILRTEDGRETVIERYRDLVMTADDGTKIIILACENQDEIHYGMPVRGMLYDAISYTEQIRELQKIHRAKKGSQRISRIFVRHEEGGTSKSCGQCGVLLWRRGMEWETGFAWIVGT